MPRFTDDDIREAAKLLHQTELSTDIFGQPDPRQESVIAHLASVLLGNPDFWPRLIWYWVQDTVPKVQQWNDLLTKFRQALVEGYGENVDIPARSGYRRPDLLRIRKAVEKSLGKVSGGLRYAKDEFLYLSEQILNLDKIEVPKWHIISREILEAAVRDEMDKRKDELVNEYLDQPRKLWLILSGLTAYNELRIPWADEPRDHVTGTVIRDQDPVLDLDVDLPFDVGQGFFTLSVDGSAHLIGVSGGRRATIVCKEEPYEFHDDVQAEVRSWAGADPGLLGSNAWWEVYVDGVPYRVLFTAGFYTMNSAVNRMRSAVSPDGVPVTNVLSIFHDGTRFHLLHLSPGGRIIVGDGHAGTNANAFLRFQDWDDSDNDGHPRVTKGWVADNVLSVQVDCNSAATVSIPAGTYTAASLATTINTLIPSLSCYVEGSRLVLSTVSGGSKSYIRVLQDSEPMGLVADQWAKGQDYTVHDLQQAVEPYDIHVQDTVPELSYEGQAQLAGATWLVPSSLTGIEVGQTIWFETGQVAGESATVTAVMFGAVFFSPAVCRSVGEVVNVRIGHHRVGLTADCCVLACTASSSTLISPKTAVGSGQIIQVSSSQHGLRYVRPGDYLAGTSISISQVVGDRLYLKDRVACDMVVAHDILSEDWWKLSQLRLSSQPEYMPRFANLLNAYAHRPSAAVRAELIDLVDRLLDWASDFLSKAEQYTVRPLRPVDFLLMLFNANRYDRIVWALRNPDHLAEIFNADFEPSTAGEISRLAAQLPNLGLSFDPAPEITDVDTSTEEGDDDTEFLEPRELSPWEGEDDILDL